MRRGPAIFLLFLLLFGAAYGAWWSGREGSARLLQFQPVDRAAERPTIGSAPLTKRLVLIIVDGLRTEESHLLPSLDWLRRKGAAYRLSVPGPTYSPTVLATLLSGTPPTRHGVLGLTQEQPLGADHLVAAAQRMQFQAGGAGSPELGRLIGGGLAPWYEGTSLAELSDEIATLLEPNGPQLILIQFGDLQQASNAEQPAKQRELMAQLDRQLVTILDQIDWNSTTAMVVGSSPQAGLDQRAGAGLIPLLLAGSGVTPGAGGEATLLDLAPTVSALLGLPTPLETEGSQIQSALRIEGRPLDAITQIYLSSRWADATHSLQAYGQVIAPEEPPATAAEAADYLGRLAQQVKVARTEWLKAGLIQRLPYLGGGLLVLLLYLLLIYRHPFGKAALIGQFTYTLLFQALFFALGGRYGPDFMGLNQPLRELGLRYGLAMGGSLLLAVLVGGLILSRVEYKRSRYLAAGGLHLLLSLAVVTTLPLAIAILLIGWEFPIALPPVGLWIWFFSTVLQVILIGALSPLWTILTVWAARYGRQRWPIKEIGNPEINADKVVRLQAIRRADRRRLRS